MRGTFAALIAVAVLLIAPTQLSAKGATVRITITGGDLATPIEITDPAIASRFHVWSELNVDWSQGVVERPVRLQIYEVSFVTTRRNPSTYVIRYAIDPSTDHGYVYLPGKDDAEYADNVWLIYRKVEGNWFQASSEWEKLAHPLIAKARTNH